MQEGFYKVGFETPLGLGNGVVFLQGGKLHGGDSAIAYLGDYQQTDDSFTASVSIKRHSPGLPTVLGADNATLHLHGKFNGNDATLEGTTPANPAIRLKARLQRLSD